VISFLLAGFCLVFYGVSILHSFDSYFRGVVQCVLNTEPEVTATEATTVDTSTTVESEDDDTILLDRNTYKSIKKMDRASLETLIQDIHESGRRKGLKEAGVVDDHTGESEINLDLRELEKQIKAVKGVGEKRAEEIMGIVEKWLGVD
jgi:hypothetical protein